MAVKGTATLMVGEAMKAAAMELAAAVRVMTAVVTAMQQADLKVETVSAVVAGRRQHQSGAT